MAALAEVAIEAAVSAVERYFFSASLALNEEFFPAVVAEIIPLVFMGICYLQFDAAVFTFDSFHKVIYDLRLALLGGGHSSRLSGGRSGFIEFPNSVEAIKIEDVEGSPLILLEIEIGDSFGCIIPSFVTVVGVTFGGFIRGDEQG